MKTTKPTIQRLLAMKTDKSKLNDSMKQDTSSWILLARVTAAVVAVMAAPLALTAQTIEAILPNPDYNPVGLAGAVFINPGSGDVFVGSMGNVNSAIHRVTPVGASFSATGVDNGLSAVTRIVRDSSGVLYAAGSSTKTLKRNSTVNYWGVRESADGGNTWQTVDTFFLGNGTANSYAKGATVDAQGNVYVCGVAMNGRTPYWIVRRKPPGGNFGPALSLSGQDYSEPFEMGFCPANGAVFVVGILNYKWTVLRSLDQGTNWTAVGRWPGDDAMATAYDIACDGQSKVYVVGARGRNGFNRGWVVRMSPDGGDTWVDLLDKPDQTGAWAFGVTVDGEGNVTVSGTILTSAGTSTLPRWTVVRTSPLQQWWGTVSASWENRFRPFGDVTYSKGSGLAADASGNVYLTGELADWTDVTDPQNPITYPGSRVPLLRLVP